MFLLTGVAGFPSCLASPDLFKFLLGKAYSKPVFWNDESALGFASEVEGLMYWFLLGGLLFYKLRCVGRWTGSLEWIGGGMSLLTGGYI